MALNNFFKFIDFYRERFHFIVFIVFIGCFLKKNIFRERRREGEREKNINWLTCLPPSGDLASNSGMCPDTESNWQPFGLQVGTQFTSHTSHWLLLVCVLTRGQTHNFGVLG